MKNGGNHKDAVETATRAVWFPCLFTSLTTSVGFFSFITATLRPIKIFGVFTAIGVMVAFVMTIALLPSLLIFFKNKFENKDFSINKKNGSENEIINNQGVLIKILLFIGNFSTRNYIPLIIIFISVIIITFLGITKISIATVGNVYGTTPYAV